MYLHDFPGFDDLNEPCLYVEVKMTYNASYNKYLIFLITPLCDACATSMDPDGVNTSPLGGAWEELDLTY